MRQPHGGRNVRGAYGCLQKGHLTVGIVDEGLQHLAHQVIVVEGDIAELFQV
jgi:hypothetical protein